jgi:hypothetical protein
VHDVLLAIERGAIQLAACGNARPDRRARAVSIGRRVSGDRFEMGQKVCGQAKAPEAMAGAPYAAPSQLRKGRRNGRGFSISPHVSTQAAGVI